MSELFTAVQRKAKKEYVCHICLELIPCGAEHIHRKGKIDGKFAESRMHIHCDALADEYAAKPYFDGYLNTAEVQDWMQDEACKRCPKWDIDEHCEKNVFFCDEAMRKLLHPTVVSAAIESIKQSIGGLDHEQ